MKPQRHGHQNKQARENRHVKPQEPEHATPSLDEDDLMAIVRELKEPFILILDCVQDPHNLGAILRTADGAGVHAVVAPKDKAGLYMGSNFLAIGVGAGAWILGWLRSSWRGPGERWTLRVAVGMRIDSDPPTDPSPPFPPPSGPLPSGSSSGARSRAQLTRRAAVSSGRAASRRRRSAPPRCRPWRSPRPPSRRDRTSSSRRAVRPPSS